MKEKIEGKNEIFKKVRKDRQSAQRKIGRKLRMDESVDIDGNVYRRKKAAKLDKRTKALMIAEKRVKAHLDSALKNAYDVKGDKKLKGIVKSVSFDEKGIKTSESAEIVNLFKEGLIKSNVKKIKELKAMKTQVLSTRVPVDVLSELDELCKQNNVNRSQWLTEMIAKFNTNTNEWPKIKIVTDYVLKENRVNPFDACVDNRLSKVRELLLVKGKEYVRNGDKFHNFNRAAEMNRQTPTRALHGMNSKHLVSILDILDDIDNGKLIEQKHLEEKVGDAIVYFVLLEALIKDKFLSPGF